MGHRPHYEQFAMLFKRYRLRSEIQTLSELGNLLSEEGFVIENSLLSRWQMGNRIPREREAFLKIIELFAKRNGIESTKQANQFLASANQRDLTDEEQIVFERYLHYRKRFNIPEENDIFIGREQIVKDITWNLLSKEKVAISGVPGVGKTALAIHLGHILKQRFEHGVFFFRTDIKTLDSIIDELLHGIGYDIPATAQDEVKLSKLSEAATQKSFCIILDNVETQQFGLKLFHSLLELSVPILLTSISPLKDEQLIHDTLKSFPIQDFEELCIRILGKPFAVQNRDDLNELGELLGFLPISSVIILKQILINPMSLKDYVMQIKKSNIYLKELSYDNKDLFSSIELCFNNLNEIERKVLTSCSIFDGADFSIEAVGAMNNLSAKELVSIFSTFVKFSMVEYSLQGRYRLHPVIKMFIKNSSKLQQYIHKLVSYYVSKLQKLNTNTEHFFHQELENIIGLITICSVAKLFTELIAVWSSVKIHLWYLGQWNYIITLRIQIIQAYRHVKDYRGLILYMSEDLCRIYFYTNNRAQESYYLNASLKRAQLLQDNVILGLVQQKYGFINLDRGNLQQAREKLEESIKLLNSNGPKKDLIKSYIYLGKTFTKLGSYEKAITCLKLTLKKSRYYNIVEDIGLSHIFLGDLYTDMKNYSLAENHYHKGLMIEHKIARKLVTALGYQGLANLHNKLSDKTSAQYYYKKARGLFEELTMKKEVQILSEEIRKLQIKRI